MVRENLCRAFKILTCRTIVNVSSPIEKHIIRDDWRIHYLLMQSKKYIDFERPSALNTFLEGNRVILKTDS